MKIFYNEFRIEFSSEFQLGKSSNEIQFQKINEKTTLIKDITKTISPKILVEYTKKTIIESHSKTLNFLFSEFEGK